MKDSNEATPATETQPSEGERLAERVNRMIEQSRARPGDPSRSNASEHAASDD